MKRRFKKEKHIDYDTGEIMTIYSPTMLKKGSVLISDKAFPKARSHLYKDSGFVISTGKYASSKGSWWVTDDELLRRKRRRKK